MGEENPIEVQQRGVGAVLSVKGRTRAMNRFFGNLPSSYGVPIDQDNAHVTLVDSAETTIDVFSERDLIVLRNTGTKMFQYLAALPLESMVLKPDLSTNRLEKFGAHLGILLRNTHVEDIRSTLRDIVIGELGINLGGEYEPHMSVSRVGRGRKRTKDHVPQFPSNFHVDGFSVDERIFSSNPARLRSKQSFHNKPKNYLTR